jgi:3-oxoadipate enol-lactonase
VAAVLIHELGGSLESWDLVAPGLEGALQLVRYDQRGHGGSARVCAPYTLDDQVGDLDAVLQHTRFAQPCWLIAAAAGSAIAVEYAVRYPTLVAGIVMCAPALDIDASRRRYLRDRADAVTRDGMAAIADATLARSWPPMLRGEGGAFECYRARLVAGDPLGYAFANRALSDIDLSARLPAISCPCLFLAGEHDVLRPPSRVAAQAAQVPHAAFAIVPAGHLMAMQDAPAVIAKIVAFIAESQR